VSYPIADSGGIGAGSIELARWWRDQASAIEVGDVIELIDENDDDLDSELPGQASTSLVVVNGVDHERRTVSFDKPDNPDDVPRQATLVRRWDHSPKGDRVSQGALLIGTIGRDGATPVGQTLSDVGGWLPLEDGIQVQFVVDADPPQYRAGDYWLIPARVATRGILWPSADGQLPDGVPAHYSTHHYAPIACIETNDETIIHDLRRTFGGLATDLPVG
jgi:hypothetical protein